MQSRSGIVSERLFCYNIIMRKLIVLFSLFLFFPSAISAAEAILFLSSGSGAYLSGKSLTTKMMVNSGGEVGVNAAESTVYFNPKQIKVKSVDKTNSIFSLWPIEPKFDNAKGTISFGGGVPKTAFKDTAGLIFSLTLTPLVTGNIDMQFSTTSSSVLAADGQGKNILKDLDDATYIFGSSATVADAEKLRSKMSGRILLQVERNGRSWYVYPVDNKRYFLGRKQDAFNLMRKLGLGITHKYLTTYIDKTFPKAVAGKILLDVETNGEAYYINPLDMKGYYLGRPDDAYTIMRNFGLGITNANLKKIPDWAI